MLHLLSYKRTGGATQSVTDLSVPQSAQSCWKTIEPRPFPLSLISILFTVLWLDVCTTFLKPFYYIFGSCSSAKVQCFLLNANVFIEYPFMKRNLGKLAIGQSINFLTVFLRQFVSSQLLAKYRKHALIVISGTCIIKK